MSTGDCSEEAEEVVVTKSSRALLKAQRPVCCWLTGLSGAGKTTIANLLEIRLNELGKHTYILDGDKIRHGLCIDLDFSQTGRAEQTRRVGHVAKMMVDAGLIVIVAVISPLRYERDQIRQYFEPQEFIEIYVDTPLEICEARDVKGLYAKARRQEIADFTGISSPYQPPLTPDITLHCWNTNPHTSLEYLVSALSRLGIIDD